MKKGEGHYRVYLAHRAALIDYAAPILGSRETAEDIVDRAGLEARIRLGAPDGAKFRLVIISKSKDSDRLDSSIDYPALVQGCVRA